MSEVVLYGIWSGSTTKRVELALKLKGIPYNYVEEDMSNKSEWLLRYNPVHKQVPVLVHNGRAIAESLVILEYIEECWKDEPLLPDDPCERAKVRFWANFFDQKFHLSNILKSEGEERARSMEELLETQRILEEGLKREFEGKMKPFLHGERPGFLDIVMGSSGCSYRAMEEAVGAKLIDRQVHPLLHSWVTALIEHPVVKETLPPHHKLVARIQEYKTQYSKA